eukprot:TRINITY_DN771_c0_g1_i1.p1 TRINITY_DN771_c0_g1~~TRINITY_DN771_c0_g1_i1.p1  ORF type:complete len:209 (+),score=29.28 TRINITY_DN771_c0_g1_i1:68-694(+)
MAQMAQMSADEKLAQELQQAELGQGQVLPPVVQGMPVRPGAAPVVLGTVAPGSTLPAVIAAVNISAEELIVLNYGMGVSCFAILDFIMTTLNVASFIVPHGHHGTAKFHWWGLLGLIFLAGPICGIFGARTLNRGLVGVYLAFCALKAGVQIAIVVMTFWIWPVLLAIVQIWITKIVGTFFHALGYIAPERRVQLRDEKEAPVHMVYW